MRPPRRFSVRLRAFHFCCDLPAAFVSSCGRGRFAFAALCPPCSLCRVSGRFSACRRCLRLLRCSRTPGRATRRASLHVRREHTRHPCVHRCSRPYRTAAPVHLVAAVAVRPRCPPRVVARALGAHAVSVFPWAFALLLDGRADAPRGGRSRPSALSAARRCACAGGTRGVRVSVGVRALIGRPPDAPRGGRSRPSAPPAVSPSIRLAGRSFFSLSIRWLLAAFRAPLPVL